MSAVLFHRDFQRFQGGHLKVFHYFEHVLSSPAHDARVRYSTDPPWDASNPWSNHREAVLGHDDPYDPDVLFLAGMDWRALDPAQRAGSRVPIFNLIQGFRHISRDQPASRFLAHRAIRICVSPELCEALQGDAGVEGPVFTVPIGIDLEQLPRPRPQHERDIDCVVLAVKDAELGEAIAARIRARGMRVLLVNRPVDRGELLDAMARARVTVHLPARREGAYMPALESMALGALVVCPDCVGNRSFCRDGETCLMPKYTKRAIVKAALTALTASDDDLSRMLAAAQEESARHGLRAERERFLELLDSVDAIWARR